MIKIAVLCCSMRRNGHSKVLASLMTEYLHKDSVDAELIDLTDYDLPICDEGDSFKHTDALTIKDKLKKVHGILVTLPVYNYNVNSAAKNLIELTGKEAWDQKIVGFACAAGGGLSYMSVMSFANSLMLDFRCVIVPRFVYAVHNDFTDNKLTNPPTIDRLQQLVQTHTQFTKALTSE